MFDNALDSIKARFPRPVWFISAFVSLLFSLVTGLLANLWPDETKREIARLSRRHMGFDMTPIIFKILFWSFPILLLLTIGLFILSVWPRKAKKEERVSKSHMPTEKRRRAFVDVADGATIKGLTLEQNVIIGADDISLLAVEGMAEDVTAKGNVHVTVAQLGERGESAETAQKLDALADMRYEGLLLKQDFVNSPAWSEKWRKWQGRMHDLYSSISVRTANTMQVDYITLIEERETNGLTQAEKDLLVLTRMLEDLFGYLTQHGLKP